MFAPARGAESLPFWLALAIAACGQAKPVGPVSSTPCTSGTARDARGETVCADGAGRPETASGSSAPGQSVLAGGAPLGGSAAGSSGAYDALLGTRAAEETTHGTDAPGAPDNEGEACPRDMRLVDTTYCSNMQRTCVEEEYSPQNKITICHRFATKQRCVGREEHRRFCIDEYEYPNKKGAHPTWMVSWYDAQATCGSLGKRLCYESEWVSACEGPDHTPFPYGQARDNTKCNIDNQWIQPSLVDIYSKDPQTRLLELSRLDQSAPSGALPGCVSGFGVRDLTGNFDEWVTVDQYVDDKSGWAGLKGGAWGHVRNACRPMTTSHPPDFTYYFIAFRCCREARGGDPSPPSYAGAPEVPPENRAPIQDPAYPPGPSSTKVGREHWPKPDAPKPQ
ncbi:MAG: SUMF1/EgtB/PvdO family nonheme iron enzyme [Polyangiaceae bacterium]